MQESKVKDSKVDIPAAKSSKTDVPVGGSSGGMEREEGELSPSPEGDSAAVHYACANNLVAKENGVKDTTQRQHEEDDVEGEVELEGEHDADADDEGEESAQKSSEDSENASEAGEEVSGSESGDGDDASHEEDEEDEDDDHEGKAESEGEAECMADADDGEGDGNSSLTSSDRSFALCKPLAAQTAMAESFVNAPGKDGEIFYGNDSFCVLFRLHQVIFRGILQGLGIAGFDDFSCETALYGLKSTMQPVYVLQTLYERISSAKTNSFAAEQKWKHVKDTTPPNLYARQALMLCCRKKFPEVL